MDEVLTHLRAICLTLPEAVEDGGVGDPTFKVRGKIFAMRHGVGGRPALWCKGPRGFQALLIASDPVHFFVPPYVGQHGWIGVWLDRPPAWSRVAELVTDSYRLTAPKRLAAQIKQGSSGGKNKESS
jgi:predicted DNA-binding protein (MmcQ/YjbR family)